MSKRSRRKREDARPADHWQSPEPQVRLKGKAFAKFEASVDEGLEALVARWAHLAPPRAALFRRMTPAPSPIVSDEAASGDGLS